MSKIYLVSSGSYSDYGIDAVFSARENAKLYMATFQRNGYDDYNDIEEKELDPCVEDIKSGRKAFHVEMEYDGSCTVGDMKYEPTPLCVDAFGWDGNTCTKMHIVGDVMAKDEHHAIKIASEFRAQAIAAGAMISVEEIKGRRGRWWEKLPQFPPTEGDK